MDPAPRIMVIDPALKTPELDCFNAMSARSVLPLTYHLPALYPSTLPDIAAGVIAGVVILGSGASVHDGYPWQESLQAWLTEVIESNTPVLGLCYGHQLLAHMFGGEVSLLWDGHKAKGMREVTLLPNRLWGGRLDALFVVSHREGVTRCPEQFEIVGQSTLVDCDAMAHVTLPVWGFQPHIEATEEFLTNNEVPGPTSMGVLSAGHELVGRFLDWCHERARTQT